MSRSDELAPTNGTGPNSNSGNMEVRSSETAVTVTRVHLYDYLIVLARYRWFLILVIVGGGLLAATYFYTARQSFTAGATLLPPDKSEGVNLAALMKSGSALDIGALSENSSAETFARILLSRTLADSLIDRLDLLPKLGFDSGSRAEAIEEVLGGFTVVPDRQGFIDVSYTVKTGFMPSREEQREAAELSAAVVNNAVEVLDKLNQQKSVTRARRSREFIGRMKEIKRGELDSVQRELLRFQQKNKAIALDQQIEASVQGLVDIQTQIQKKELELTVLQQEFNSDTRMVESVRKQIAQLNSQKSRLEGGRIGGEALSIPLSGVPDLTRQFANLKLNLEVATQIYTYLEAQYNQEQIQEARELPTVSVMDYATPPVRRSAPKRTLMVLVTIAALSVAALLGVFFIDTYRRSWRSLDQTKRLRLRETLGLKPKQYSTTDMDLN